MPSGDHMTERRVRFNASEVAAVLGENPYEKAWEAVCKVWRRYSPSTYEASGVREHIEAARVDDLAEADADVRELLRRAGAADPLTLTLTSDPGLPPAAEAAARARGLSPRALADRVRKESCCGHGTTQEPAALGELPGVVPGEEYHKRPLRDARADVGGRVDGLTSDGACVVEIKNRVAGLALKLHAYELPQLYCYMYVLGARRARLIERLVLRDGRALSSVHEIEWSEALWESRIAARLRRAALFVERLAADPEFAAAFARSRTRNATYMRWLDWTD